MAERDEGTPDETRDWVEAAAAGDPDAWDALYRRFRPLMACALSRRIPDHLRGRFDTEDVLQSAFLAAYTGLADYEHGDGESFRAWLTRISRNKLLDRIRAHDRSRRSAAVERGGLDLDGLTEDPRAGESPSVLVSRAERSAEILAALSQLGERKQALVWMRQFEQRTWQEIAAELDCPESSARRWHAEALRDLVGRITGGEEPGG